MEFQDFESRIQSALKKPLPGEDAQHIMAPLSRLRLSNQNIDQQKVRKAGVLALFEESQGATHFIVIRRTEYEGVHSGQISLPGGAREKQDDSFLATALRETHEEIGVEPSLIKVFGALSPLYIPPSNFLVYPFIGLAKEALSFEAEQKEVKTIHRLPVKELLQPETQQWKEVRVSNGLKMKVPALVFNELVIWGATSMILSELRSMLHPEWPKS